jgi:hypothetical protein
VFIVTPIYTITPINTFRGLLLCGRWRNDFNPCIPHPESSTNSGMNLDYLWSEPEPTKKEEKKSLYFNASPILLFYRYMSSDIDANNMVPYAEKNEQFGYFISFLHNRVELELLAK